METKTIFKIVGAVTAVVGTVVVVKYVIRSVAEAKAREIQIQLQREEASKPAQEQSSAKNYNPSADARYIKKLLHGANLLMYPEVTELIMNLSDDKTKKLYDHYNKYFKENGRTLTKQLEEEWNHMYPLESVYVPAIKKLKALGLR